MSAAQLQKLLEAAKDLTISPEQKEEQRLIENSLTELRFRYVQASEEAAKSNAAAEPAS